MKPNKLHKELCELVIKQAEFWRDTNDINSPTHYCDNEAEVNMFVIDGKINDIDAEELVHALDELYHAIKNIGLLNNKD